MNDFYVGKIDLSQIECRLLNTVAGQWDIVEKFANGIDLYSDLATKFYGFLVDKSNPAERGTGKQLELSCGYGAGGPTIVRTARAGTYGPPVYLSQQQGTAARDLYRGTHDEVVKLWDTGKRMLWHLMDGATVPWGCMTVHDHRIFGPGEPGDQLWLDFSSLEYVTLDGEEKPTFRHMTRTGPRRTYGARLIENVIQFLASIVIRQAMHRLRALGFETRLQVHDDVYFLVPRAGQCSAFLIQMLAEMEDVSRSDDHVTPQEILRICTREVARPLDWLSACPIEAEGELLTALAGDQVFKYTHSEWRHA